MTLDRITRSVYGLLGVLYAVLYVVLGAGSMLVPTGWLPEHFSPDALIGQVPSPFVGHLLQEFGTVVIALGLVFLWYATSHPRRRGLHWAITCYFPACRDVAARSARAQGIPAQRRKIAHQRAMLSRLWSAAAT